MAMTAGTTVEAAGPRRWCAVRAVSQSNVRTAWRHLELAEYAGGLNAAWSYPDASPEVGDVAGFTSFEPDEVEVSLDGRRLRLEFGRGVLRHGGDSDLSLDEASLGGGL